MSLLQLADLIDILSLPGPVTVFAPTNEAFDGLPTPLFKVVPMIMTSLESIVIRNFDFYFQSLLSKPKELQLTLLRHMTKGDIKSSSFPAGSTPLVTGAGEKLMVTTL